MEFKWDSIVFGVHAVSPFFLTGALIVEREARIIQISMAIVQLKMLSGIID
jgi:hypothetical protein